MLSPRRAVDPVSLRHASPCRATVLVSASTIAYNSPGMRYSRLFIKTLVQVPKDVRSSSHKLLLQGGFVRTVGRGLFTVTPLGMRVLRNIKRIIHEEMHSLGGQEVLAPIVNPREMWINSGRDSLIGEDMIRFHDRIDRELVMAPTHEEAMVELVRDGIRSYRDLPVFLYQFQTKFRDEARARCGLLRAREFIMSDAYSFHRSFTDLNGFFPQVFAAYGRIFERCGVPVTPAQAGVGYMGGERSYEFLLPCEYGDDYLIHCTSCSYAANEEIAVGHKELVQEPPQPIDRVEVADQRSLSAARQYLELPRNRLVKAMLYCADGGLIMAVVRGDYHVSEEKLAHVVQRPIQGRATGEQLARYGLDGPWLSPLDVPDSARGRLTVVVDDAVADSSNLFAGANEAGVAWRNVNFGRDFDADYVADVSRIPKGARCKHCSSGVLERLRAIELGHIFRLGDYYTRSMNLSLSDERGRAVYPHMGSYGIGLGRLMAAIVEVNHDENGIIWPMEVAPFTVFLMSIGKSLSVRRLVEEIYAELPGAVLFDDRRESISHKLKDADLLGIPIRLVVSGDSVSKGIVELAIRGEADTRQVHRDELGDAVRAIAHEYAHV